MNEISELTSHPAIPPELFPSMLSFFNYFDQLLLEKGIAKLDCGDCRQCCTTPLLMTCSDLEAELILQYLKEKKLNLKLQFKAITGEEPDLRENFPAWDCPLCQPETGCLVYRLRPYACRIAGPLRQSLEDLPGCCYQNPLIYRTPREIPGWEAYAAILRQYDFKRGYLLPGRIFSLKLS